LSFFPEEIFDGKQTILQNQLRCRCSSHPHLVFVSLWLVITILRLYQGEYANISAIDNSVFNPVKSVTSRGPVGWLTANFMTVLFKALEAFSLLTVTADPTFLGENDIHIDLFLERHDVFYS
jgi:hypothetical protein